MALSYRTGTGAMNLDSQGRSSRFMTRRTSTAIARNVKKRYGGGKIVY